MPWRGGPARGTAGRRGGAAGSPGKAGPGCSGRGLQGRREGEGGRRARAAGNGNGAPPEPGTGTAAGAVGNDLRVAGPGRHRFPSKADLQLVQTDGYTCSKEAGPASRLCHAQPVTQQHLIVWDDPPRTCLVLRKPGEGTVQPMVACCAYLHGELGMQVVLEPWAHAEVRGRPDMGFAATFDEGEAGRLSEIVDFVVCLGGDGVILHASHLFRGPIPPVLSFNLGSLGFLTSHDFKSYCTDIFDVVSGSSVLNGVYVTLRMRLRCKIYRKGRPRGGEAPYYDVLNEVVVDRGPGGFLSMIECYERDRLITKVQVSARGRRAGRSGGLTQRKGDGVMLATPTGSTAYSAAAGGSICHPCVPAILFTPICPHALSFRPVMLPDSSEIELKIPETARESAWVCFDGQDRQELECGDSVKICMSPYPMPTVNKRDETDDWFASLVRCLNWNERTDQRPFDFM